MHRFYGLRRIFARLLATVFCAYAVSACGVPAPDPSTAQGKAQILDDVEQYLNTGDCGDALTEITPLYDSSNSDNSVRMEMASVYGCFSGFNFYGFVNKATSANVSSLSFLFEFMAQEFPSTSPSDKVVESAGYGIDSLMAALNPGEVLITTDLINTSTNNEGSLLDTDRTTASNEYLFFLTMAAMGGEENRLGANSSTGAPNSANELPWTTYNYSSGGTSLATDGCTYASSLLNFADSIQSVSESGNGCGSQPSSSNVLAYVAWGLNCLTSDTAGVSFSQLVYDACMYGCQNVTPTFAGQGAEGAFMSANGAWTSPCNADLDCSSCSLLLRDRGNCSGQAGDVVSCSAAGLINLVNKSAIGWQ